MFPSIRSSAEPKASVPTPVIISSVPSPSISLPVFLITLQILLAIDSVASFVTSSMISFAAPSVKPFATLPPPIYLKIGSANFSTACSNAAEPIAYAALFSLGISGFPTDSSINFEAALPIRYRPIVHGFAADSVAGADSMAVAKPFCNALPTLPSFSNKSQKPFSPPVGSASLLSLSAVSPIFFENSISSHPSATIWSILGSLSAMPLFSPTSGIYTEFAAAERSASQTILPVRTPALPADFVAVSTQDVFSSFAFSSLLACLFSLRLTSGSLFKSKA